MVLDAIENADRYLHLGEGIAKALNFIRNNDLVEVQPGKYEIEQDQLLMLVNEYEISNTNEVNLEGHFQNIDLQYWVEGSELMGHATLNGQTVLEPYDESTDCILYESSASFTRLTPGMFVIYFPTDLHTAIVDPDSTRKVKKVVFKIRVD